MKRNRPAPRFQAKIFARELILERNNGKSMNVNALIEFSIKTHMG